tara:strand:- start:13 stop:324 length:312 start_codon:yes stop_codon:yes gene_type:complete
MKDKNEIIKEDQARDGLYQVTYANGLTLSIGQSATHYSMKRFTVPLTVEVAIKDKDGEFVPLTEYDDVAQVTIAQFEMLTEKMERLPADHDEAAQELWHWAMF